MWLRTNQGFSFANSSRPFFSIILSIYLRSCVLHQARVTYFAEVLQGYVPDSRNNISVHMKIAMDSFTWRVNCLTQTVSITANKRENFSSKNSPVSFLIQFNSREVAAK